MSLLEATKSLLRTHRIFPNKSLGQNFTVEPSVFRHMMDYALLDQSDVVLDVGAGLGFLSCSLAGKCKSVFAVEADAGLVEVLREQVGNLSNVQVLRGSVFKVQIPFFNKVVSIPPYQISSRLVLWLFGRDLDGGVLVLQKEFANRLMASIGSDDYGWLTAVTYYYSKVELLDEVPNWMFYPQPGVDSIIVRLKPKKPSPFILEDRALFVQLVKSLFRNRNRKVRNAVLPILMGICALTAENAVEKAKALPYCNERVRELAPEDLGALTNAIAG
jgi:16S rRNA (adenine1518-N6/adenine1519-N6)-dimethyltransferase